MANDAVMNLTVGAYRDAQAEIIACRRRPGEKLVISDICKELGVSLGAVPRRCRGSPRRGSSPPSRRRASGWRR